MRTWAVEIAQGTRHPRPGFCPEDAGASEGYDGCYGLRSGPKAGRFGCVWHTEAAGFAAGSRQFVDKSAPTKTEVANKRSVVRSVCTYCCDFKQSRSVKSLRMSAMRLSRRVRCSGVLWAVMSTNSEMAAFSVWS